MQYPTQCFVEEMVSKEQSRYAINSAYLEGNALKATNGKALVLIPVKREDDDADGAISIEALKAVRKHKAGGIKANGSLIVEAGGVTATFERPDVGTFPKTEDIIPKDTAGTVKFNLSGPLLIKLIKAMGAHKNIGEGCGALTFFVQENPESKPIRIEHTTDDGIKTIGVIMPVRLKD